MLTSPPNFDGRQISSNEILTSSPKNEKRFSKPKTTSRPKINSQDDFPSLPSRIDPNSRVRSRSPARNQNHADDLGFKDSKLAGNRLTQMQDSFLSQNKQAQFYANKAKKPQTFGSGRLRGDRINQPKKF